MNLTPIIPTMSNNRRGTEKRMPDLPKKLREAGECHFFGTWEGEAAIEAADRIEKLEAALEELACRHVTDKPLWWQMKARQALNP